MLRRGGANLYGTMIVAMVAVRMVELAVDQVVDVIAVRHRLVAAAGSMFVRRIMPSLVAKMVTPIRIQLAYGKDVFLNRVALLMVKMTILQEVDVPIMFNRRMSAAGTV
jgi:hypothetical protein